MHQDNFRDYLVTSNVNIGDNYHVNDAASTSNVENTNRTINCDTITSTVRSNLRSIQDVPSPYRDVFDNYPFFNVIQSEVFEDVFCSDASLVVSAPTGSGKTAIFELAIVKLLMSLEASKFKKDYKMIYIGPMKALCEERVVDWHKKFSNFGVTCISVTGDSVDVDYSSLVNNNLIITTPEKWDSLTRKWRDNDTIVQCVKLFMIDEIHLLNDETRGPTLEAIVSRMKTTQEYANFKASDKNRIDVDVPDKIRFVGVSATIPNVRDLAEWFGPPDQPAKHFRFNDDMRPVKLQKIVLGYHYNAAMSTPFKFDIMLNYKLSAIMLQHAVGKPTLIFCSTRKSVEMTAKHLIQNLTVSLSQQQREVLANAAGALSDVKVKETLVHGVGSHHAGMLLDSRKAIENLFRQGHLPILVTTSTLSMGVNLPAHLVIIKSTKYYADGEYRDYSESTLFQMIGRAGRPQYDTSATAVIMTTAGDKNKYEHMVGGQQVVESFLHRRLAEYINAEVVLGTITDLGVAMEWLSSTYLYIRARKNPRFYGLQQALTPGQLDKKLLDMCHIEVNKLSRAGMLTIDENTLIIPTHTGSLMARYCIALPTMKLFTKVTGREGLQQMLNLIAKCHEFSDIRLRSNDKKTLNLLNKCRNKQTIRFTLNGKIKTIDMKISCIIQAVLGCLEILESSLLVDSQRIMRIGERLLSCLVEYLEPRANCYSALLNTIILAKCFQARIWEDSHYVSRQLAGIGVSLSNLLVAAGKTSFQSILDSNPRDLERILNRKTPTGNKIHDQISRLPKYSLSVKETISGNSKAAVEVRISLDNVANFGNDITVNPESVMHFLIGDCDNHVVLHEKYTHGYMVEHPSVCKIVEVESTNGRKEIFINFISQDWVGIDAKTSIVLFDPSPEKDNFLDKKRPQKTPHKASDERVELEKKSPQKSTSSRKPGQEKVNKPSKVGNTAKPKSAYMQQFLDTYFKQEKPNVPNHKKLNNQSGAAPKIKKLDSESTSTKVADKRDTTRYENKIAEEEKPMEGRIEENVGESEDNENSKTTKLANAINKTNNDYFRNANRKILMDIINKETAASEYENGNPNGKKSNIENQSIGHNVRCDDSNGGLKMRFPKYLKATKEVVKERQAERQALQQFEFESSLLECDVEEDKPKIKQFMPSAKKKLKLDDSATKNENSDAPDSKKIKLSENCAKNITWRSPLVVSQRVKFSPNLDEAPNRSCHEENASAEALNTSATSKSSESDHNKSLPTRPRPTLRNNPHNVSLADKYWCDGGEKSSAHSTSLIEVTRPKIKEANKVDICDIVSTTLLDWLGIKPKEVADMDKSSDSAKLMSNFMAEKVKQPKKFNALRSSHYYNHLISQVTKSAREETSGFNNSNGVRSGTGREGQCDRINQPDLLNQYIRMNESNLLNQSNPINQPNRLDQHNRFQSNNKSDQVGSICVKDETEFDEWRNNSFVKDESRSTNHYEDNRRYNANHNYVYSSDAQRTKLVGDFDRRGEFNNTTFASNEMCQSLKKSQNIDQYATPQRHNRGYVHENENGAKITDYYDSESFHGYETDGVIHINDVSSFEAERKPNNGLYGREKINHTRSNLEARTGDLINVDGNGYVCNRNENHHDVVYDQRLNFDPAPFPTDLLDLNSANKTPSTSSNQWMVPIVNSVEKSAIERKHSWEDDFLNNEPECPDYSTSSSKEEIVSKDCPRDDVEATFGASEFLFRNIRKRSPSVGEETGHGSDVKENRNVRGLRKSLHCDGVRWGTGDGDEINKWMNVNVESLRPGEIYGGDSKRRYLDTSKWSEFLKHRDNRNERFQRVTEDKEETWKYLNTIRNDFIGVGRFETGLVGDRRFSMENNRPGNFTRNIFDASRAEDKSGPRKQNDQILIQNKSRLPDIKSMAQQSVGLIPQIRNRSNFTGKNPKFSNSYAGNHRFVDKHNQSMFEDSMQADDVNFEFPNDIDSEQIPKQSSRNFSGYSKNIEYLRPERTGRNYPHTEGSLIREANCGDFTNEINNRSCFNNNFENFYGIQLKNKFVSPKEIHYERILNPSPYVRNDAVAHAHDPSRNLSERNAFVETVSKGGDRMICGGRNTRRFSSPIVYDHEPVSTRKSSFQYAKQNKVESIDQNAHQQICNKTINYEAPPRTVFCDDNRRKNLQLSLEQDNLIQTSRPHERSLFEATSKQSPNVYENSYMTVGNFNSGYSQRPSNFLIKTPKYQSCDQSVKNSTATVPYLRRENENFQSHDIRPVFSNEYRIGNDVRYENVPKSHGDELYRYHSAPVGDNGAKSKRFLMTKFLKSNNTNQLEYDNRYCGGDGSNQFNRNHTITSNDAYFKNM